jgi:hypothetical protein
MDEDTARSILGAATREYRRWLYQALAAIVGHIDAREVREPDGTRDQLDLQVLWDENAGGAVRVLGPSMTVGFVPSGRSRSTFIRNPAGSLAGE